MDNLHPAIQTLLVTTELWVFLVAVILYWSLTGRGILSVGPNVPRWILLIVAVLGAIVIVYAAREFNARV